MQRQELKQLFATALELSGDERHKFVAEKCDTHPDLAEELKQLIADHDAKGASLPPTILDGAPAPHSPELPAVQDLSTLDIQLFSEKRTVSDLLAKHSPILQAKFLTSIRAMALVKIFGIVAIALLFTRDAFAGRDLIYTALVICFSAAGLFLSFGTRNEIRATALGTLYLLLADAFVEPLIVPRDGTLGTDPLTRFLLGVTPEAFIAYFFARFVSRFPKNEYYIRSTFAYRLRNTAFLAGMVLFAVTAVTIARSPSGIPKPFAHLIETDIPGPRSYFWTILLLLMIPSAILSIYRTRRAPSAEKRRVRQFALCLVLGITPILLSIVLRLNPDNPILVAINYMALLSVPLTTSYVVAVHRLLDIRLVVRQAIEYAFARYSILVLSLVPIVLIARSLFQHRHDSLISLIAGPDAIALAAYSVLAIVAYRSRLVLLRFVDKRFFREEYEFSRTLALFVAEARAATSSAKLAEIISAHVIAALHVEHAELIIVEADGGEYRGPAQGLPPLSQFNSLGQLLRSQPFVDIDPEDENGLFDHLDRNDQQWIVDAKCRLLVRIADKTNRPMGAISLGEKRSELPFSRKDIELMRSVADSCGLVLERISDSERSPTKDSVPARGNGRSCAKCLSVYSGSALFCPRCSIPTRELTVPQVLFGKIRLERQVGVGAMGVVYLGHDITLDRKVAVKTLPRMSPQLSLRLRKEARAVAAIEHPNLAMIHAAETWKGIPLLVFEYLPGGTLADRIRKREMDLREVIHIGMSLADALDQMHALGILHRDVKPSNIGFTAQRVPKLLDLGLAKNLAVRERDATQSAVPDSADPRDSGTAAKYFAGTPAYMCPEAVDFDDADVHFDLWSLAVTLYEAIAGKNPFVGLTLGETIANIKHSAPRDVRESDAAVTAEVSQFFKDALHPKRSHRPSSARQLRVRLVSCLESLR